MQQQDRAIQGHNNDDQSGRRSMKKIMRYKGASGRQSASNFTSKTGEHCPQSGWWRAGLRGTKRFITEGTIMPTEAGQSVQWILTQRVAEPRPPKHPLPAVDAWIDNY
jgi:hypothetical protein